MFFFSIKFIFFFVITFCLSKKKKKKERKGNKVHVLEWIILQFKFYDNWFLSFLFSIVTSWNTWYKYFLLALNWYFSHNECFSSYTQLELALKQAVSTSEYYSMIHFMLDNHLFFFYANIYLLKWSQSFMFY